MPSLVDLVSASSLAMVTLRKKTAAVASTSLAHIGVKSVVKSANRTSTISVNHYDSLVDELRCPSCANPLCAPIRLCQSGHSVCALCTQLLNRCPLCAKSFTANRSITLETLAAKAVFNCPNDQHGCPARLPQSKLRQHELRCVYQMGDCFMGRVWGDCDWQGREMDWLEHCEAEHADRMFFQREMDLQWQSSYEQRPKPISAYYIFRALGETFNMYQLYDKRMQRISWTLICASKDERVSKKYAYEVELYSPADPARLQIRRQPVSGELDEDVLDDGRGAAFDMGEVFKFMDAYRVLHYRVRIMTIPSQTPSPSTLRVAAIREAKVAFLADGHAIPAPDEVESNSVTSSIVVAHDHHTDGNDSSSSYEHVSNEKTIAPKVDENAFKTEFPAEPEELQSPKLLARVNSIPKPPRHSLDRAVTMADVIELQPLLGGQDGGETPPTPPSSPMPKDDKVIAFAKSNVD